MTDSDRVGAAIPQEDEVCALADALRPGDEVVFNNRSRPIEVLGREVDRGSGLINGSDYPYRVVHLRGNGTEYRLRYSHTGEYWPRMHSESQLEASESYSVKHGEPRPFVRATGPGERIREVQIVGVDDEELTDWALARNIEGLEEVDTDAD